LRITGQDRKRQPINGEGEARIHGIYRTPVRSAVGSAPVLPRRGPFRSAPQPIGMRRGPALLVDGEADSTVFSVLLVLVGSVFVGRPQRPFLLLPSLQS
jgi:hypothetical protein